MATKKIEYPKLKKIGGLKNFFKQSFLSLAIITVIATTGGYLAGNFMQQGFRDLTGFKKEVTTAIETTEREKLPTNMRYNEEGNLVVGILADTMNMTTNALNAVTYSKIMQAANDSAWKILSITLYPLFVALDWAAFWFTFTLAFIICAWLVNKLITLRNKALNSGTDPQLIKNMEILEAKVKELVDNANKN